MTTAEAGGYRVEDATSALWFGRWPSGWGDVVHAVEPGEWCSAAAMIDEAGLAWNVEQYPLEAVLGNREGGEPGQVPVPRVVANVRSDTRSVLEMGTNEEAAVYAASKAAVIAMTRTFAHAYADRGVRVNCVCPGLIDTSLYASVLEQLGRARQASREAIVSARERAVPLTRVGDPSEVASAIWFLLACATYVTGEALNVSGGLVMH